MSIESEKDLLGLQAIGAIVAACVRHLEGKVQPGVTTLELDGEARKFLTERGARSAPELVYDFPGSTCISINPDIAHGIPGDRRLQPGDIVNIDVSAELDGYFADTGATFQVPPQTKEAQRLCRATQEALEAAMSVACHGTPLNEIGRAIQSVARRYGYSVIENLGSHGVGRALHEEPKFIAPYHDRKERRVLKEDMVITIEPFLSTGARWVEEREDGWTLGTPREFLSAQYEHTLVITRSSPIVITC